MNEKQLETLRKNNEESRLFARSCVAFALVTLLNKGTEYKDISITKLCLVAGVSRQAFYRNYNSVDDVLSDKIKEVALKMGGLMEIDVYNNWYNIFKCVDENRFLFETVIKAGFEHKILETFLSLLPEDEENRTIQTIWLSVFYSMIVKWIKEKRPRHLEDIAKIAYKYTKNIPLVMMEE